MNAVIIARAALGAAIALSLSAAAFDAAAQTTTYPTRAIR